MSAAAIASTLIGMSQAQTRMGIQAVLVRQQHQADQSVANLLASAVEAMPAPGTGLVVDKKA
jgi:hypothetical protein